MRKRYLLLLVAAIFAATTNSLPAESRKKVKITAHRGFWDTNAAKNTENTVDALRAAQYNGFWGCEFDLHITSDDVVVVHHDPTIQGVDIHKNSYEYLQQFKLKNSEAIPTLDDFLKQGAKFSSTVLVVEFKTQDDDQRGERMVDITIEKLKEYGLYDPSRTIFITFNMNICRRLAKIAPEFTNQYLSGNLSPAELHKEGINGIDYHYSTLIAHPEWVKEAHELGMSVNVWTVNKEPHIRAVIDLGVDCITTNDPLLVRSILGECEDRITPISFPTLE